MRLLWSWHTPEAKHFTGVRPNTQETQSVKIQGHDKQGLQKFEQDSLSLSFLFKIP